MRTVVLVETVDVIESRSLIKHTPLVRALSHYCAPRHQSTPGPALTLFMATHTVSAWFRCVSSFMHVLESVNVFHIRGSGLVIIRDADVRDDNSS